MKKEEPILVAIHCLVYNHEPYLRDCFEGFVKQKTNFRFVAIVHDDCSKDKSAAIIREYAEKYPDIIKPIYETENQWSKRDGSIDRIMENAIEATGAKYLALCEGDDYWTNPLKLQMQVDFLESHPDYVMCCHGADVLNETNRKIDCACEHMTTREYFPDDAFPTWQIPTASIIYRREPVEGFELKHTEQFIAGDVVLILKCMHVGRVWGMAEHMSVYRMNQGGVTSRVNTWEDKLKLCKHYEALLENFPKINQDYCYRYIAMIHYTNFRQAHDFKKKLESLWRAIKNKPDFVVRKLLKLKVKPRNDLFYQYYGQ
jgi:glycosyltransferase involved in cell wall biosynthesis